MGSAQCHCLPVVAVGQQSEVTDLYEPSRQNMEHEAADKLGGIESFEEANQAGYSTGCSSR